MAPSVALGTEGPIQRGWTLWLLSVVMVVVAGLFVLLRTVERLRREGFGFDDWVVIAALASSVILSMTEIEAVVNGYGHHAKTLTHAQLIAALKWFYAAQIVYKLVIALDKVAILLLYYRVFYVDRGFRIASHCLNAFIISTGVAFILVTIFQCTPISGVWEKGYEKAVCINSKNFWISYAVVNIFTDVVLLAMPLHQLTRLKISRLDKLGLSLVFGTVLVFTAASIIRTTTLAGSAHDKDATWGPIPATNWSVIEANVGIIAACLPTLRHPFILVFDRIISRHDSKGMPNFQGRGSREQGAKPKPDVEDRLSAVPHRAHRRLDDESTVGNKTVEYDLDTSWNRPSLDSWKGTPGSRDHILPCIEHSPGHAPIADTSTESMPSRRGNGNDEEDGEKGRKIYVEVEVSTEVRQATPSPPNVNRSDEFDGAFSQRYAPRNMRKEDAQREYYLKGVI